MKTVFYSTLVLYAILEKKVLFLAKTIVGPEYCGLLPSTPSVQLIKVNVMNLYY